MSKVQICKSTDFGSPDLPGEIGSLIPVLDAVLANGYNPHIGATWSRSGTTLIVNQPSHNYNSGDYVTFSNGTDANVNSTLAGSPILGEKITVIDADNFSKAVTNTGAISGTVDVKKASFGWIKSFTGGATLAAYKSPFNRFIEFNDSSINSCSAMIYEDMTASGVGTSPSTSLTLNKATAVASPHHWMIISDGNYVHLLTTNTLKSANIATATFQLNGFGHFKSLVQDDAYNFMLNFSSGTFATNTAGTVSATLLVNANIQVLRNFIGTLSYPTCAWDVDAQKCMGTAVPQNKILYPDNETGGLVVQTPNVWELVRGQRRGYVPGLYFATQFALANIGNLGTQTGTSGDLTGKTLMCVACSVGTTSHFYIEISETW